MGETALLWLIEDILAKSLIESPVIGGSVQERALGQHWQSKRKTSLCEARGRPGG